MRVAYFVHDMTDSAIHRRVRMIRAGGAEVRLYGFTRGEAAVTEIEGAPAEVFGRTFDRQLAHRALSALKSIPSLGRYGKELAGADVFLARNLEMLVVAAAARARFAPRARLVYECLDIHPKMLGSGMVGKVLRRVERSLLDRSQLVITSSPAFTRNYFETRQRTRPPVALVENKALMLEGAPAAIQAPIRAPGPPWRIGWYGIQRMQKALDIICAIAAENPGLVEFVIRGRPGLVDFPDFHGQIERTPGVTFEGAYTPADLPRIYGDVHFNWAFDFFDEDSNSAWLLPNRIYEGGFYGAIPLAKPNNETGRWLARRGLGVLMEDPERQLPAFLRSLDADAYAELAGRARALPVSDVVADQGDCVRLNSLLIGEKQS